MITKDMVWKSMSDIKFNCIIYARSARKYQKYDRNVNAFLALCSSGSIAAWAFIQKYPFYWGLVIAVSQVLSVLKPFLGHDRLGKELYGRVLDMELTYLELEKLWAEIKED